MQLPERYARETPYEYLGVAPTATATELRSKFAQLERDIRESGIDGSERARRQERLKSEYDKVSTGGQRVRVDFFLIDANIGARQCQAAAEAVPKPEAKVGDVVKPRRIRVTHEALFEDLLLLAAEPERVEGLFPRPMPTASQRKLPEPLKVQFDC
jgi:hypothetical protein